MKRSFRICLITMAAATLAVSVRAGSPRGSAGPVCCWRFDGSLDDDAGQARATLASVGGQPRFAGAGELPGVSGQALALGVRPGDAQYLAAPVTDDLQLGASYTIEAWIHPTAISDWNRLVLRWGKAPDYAYHLAIHNGAASLHHGQSDGRYIFAEGGQVETGRWHHVVGVARRNALEVYLDGRLAGSATFDGSFNNPAGERLGIGDSAGIPSANCRFRGYFDELAIWNRALSPAEIAGHYAARVKVLRELEAARRKEEFAARREVFERLTKSGIEEIVFAERRASPEHYYANFGGTCTDDDEWKHGPDGGRLCKLNLRTGELTVLVDDPAGAVRDPQVHYNGRTILFAYRKGGTHHYNLHTINTNGSGLREITRGPWDDIEPCWLPDGGIVFSSSRCKRYVACWYTQVAVLFRCDADGGNLRMLSSNAVHENTPCVLPDGRILYTRWEYVNRDAVVFHHLWTTNPDGSGQQVFYGNLTPGGVFIDAQPIPDSDRVVFTLSPGHGKMEHAGRIAIVTGAGGPNASSALRLISKTADFRDPFPVSPGEFLVARNNQLLLLNEAGEESLLCAAPMMVHEPRPLRARPREPVLAPSSDLSQANATLFIQNVGEGRNMAGVRPGQVRKLLVLEDLPKPANFHGGGSTPVGIGVTSTLKRILGTVPVETDGSAKFEVPPMRSLYFALLDEHDLSIKQMRSFVTLQPGETRSCVGCHDTRTQSSLTAPAMPVAAQRAPSRIEPVAGVPEILDFPRDIQPILDRHCVRCHNPDKRDGGVVLTGDRGPVYSLSYFDLFLHWQIKDTRDEPRSGTGRQPGDDPPFATFSSASPLMRMIGGRHYDAKLSAPEIALVRLWIDTAAQYAGTYAAFGSGQIGGWWRNNEPIREMADAWPGTAPARDAIERRCGGCHGDALPRFVTDQIKVDVYADMESWQRPLTRYSRHRIFNLSRPEKSLVVLAPLAREAGGYAHGTPPPQPTRVVEDRSRPPQPVTHPVVFADTHDADYAKMLAHIEAAKARLEEIKRFDMAGFKPNAQYVRELKRYGVLPASFDLARDPLNVYAADEAYWRSMWHRPLPSGVK